MTALTPEESDHTKEPISSQPPHSARPEVNGKGPFELLCGETIKGGLGEKEKPWQEGGKKQNRKQTKEQSLCSIVHLHWKS